MRVDYRKAFSFIAKDPTAWKKILIGGLLSLIPLVNFVSAGFLVVVYRHVVSNVRDEKVLPEWEDFGEFFFKGASAVAVALCYSIAFIIPAFIVVLGVGFSTLVAGASGQHLGSAIITSLVTLVFFYGYCTVTGIALSLYCETLEISSSFQFALILSRLIEMKSAYSVLMLVYTIEVAILWFVTNYIPVVGGVFFAVGAFTVALPMVYALAALIADNYAPKITDPIDPEFIRSITADSLASMEEEEDEYGHAKAGGKRASAYATRPPETSLTWSTDSDVPDKEY